MATIPSPVSFGRVAVTTDVPSMPPSVVHPDLDVPLAADHDVQLLCRSRRRVRPRRHPLERDARVTRANRVIGAGLRIRRGAARPRRSRRRQTASDTASFSFASGLCPQSAVSFAAASSAFCWPLLLHYRLLFGCLILTAAASSRPLAAIRSTRGCADGDPGHCGRASPPARGTRAATPLRSRFIRSAQVIAASPSWRATRWRVLIPSPGAWVTAHQSGGVLSVGHGALRLGCLRTAFNASSGRS
jgi:hypothetical protein